jgi:hypothetical protein
MGQTASWFVLLLAGVLLVVIGFTGSLGKLVAVAFAPGLLEYKSGAPSPSATPAATATNITSF